MNLKAPLPFINMHERHGLWVHRLLSIFHYSLNSFFTFDLALQNQKTVEFPIDRQYVEYIAFALYAVGMTLVMGSFIKYVARHKKGKGLTPNYIPPFSHPTPKIQLNTNLCIDWVSQEPIVVITLEF